MKLGIREIASIVLLVSGIAMHFLAVLSYGGEIARNIGWSFISISMGLIGYEIGVRSSRGERDVS